MTTIDQFAARLNAAAQVEGFTDPILSEFGDIVAGKVSEHAPKRTRRSPGPGLEQTKPGVLELPAGSYLVGEVRGTSQSSPQSRNFLSDALDDARRPLAAAVAKAALSAIADVTVRRR